MALLGEKRIRASCHMQAYQRKRAHAFNKKVKPLSIRSEAKINQGRGEGSEVSMTNSFDP